MDREREAQYHVHAPFKIEKACTGEVAYGLMGSTNTAI
jgi:hypothetical protein